MSNIIPPLLSDTPPPPPDIDDHEDDEFGDFTGSNNLSYDYEDSFSPPGSPLQLPTESFEFDNPLPTEIFEVNSDSKENSVAQLDKSKDFCDKRKDGDAKLVENHVDSSVVQDSLSPKITRPPIDNIAATKLPEDDENSDELKTNEIIETNCDSKTTFNEKEISNLSNSDVKKHHKELFFENIEPVDVIFNVDESNITNIFNGNDNFNDFASASRDNVHDEPLMQYKILGNNSSLEPISEDKATKPVDSSENSATDSVELSNNDLAQVADILPSKIEDPNDIVVDNGCEQLGNTSGQNIQQLTRLTAGPVVKNLNPKININSINDDDFGDFATLPFDKNQSESSKNNFSATFTLGLSNSGGYKTHIENAEATVSNGDDDDFGDFIATSSVPPSTSHEVEDFASFPPPSQSLHDEDDFGDFAATGGECQYSKVLLLNEKQALEKSSDIVKEMFPQEERTISDFLFKGLETNDKIFNQIKNITDTHALSFQWPKSASQNLLLRALNIDSRNILYGPGCNASMPRFAANLSLTPLEPLKSEVLIPTPVKEPNPPNMSQPTRVEALQLDLNETGLTEPLDYLEQLVAQLEIPSFKSTSSSHNSSSPSNEFENWEAWLQSIPTKESSSSPDTSVKANSEEPVKPSSINSHIQASKVNLEVKSVSAIKHDDFDDFVSYSSMAVPESSHGHSIILRETHITNKEPVKPDENEIVSWLEPTIVTPELSRRERQFVEPDDEFEDFQMVVVPEEQNTKPVEISTSLTVKGLESLQPMPPVDLATLSEEAKPAANDDDFGDFTFSLPNDTIRQTASQLPAIAPSQPLTPAPLLEPLKPSLLQTQSKAQISWPDPGITDDEISRFEALGYARTQSKPPSKGGKGAVEPNKGKVKVNTDVKVSSKQNSLDDDEWSDFVSVQNSSPVHKLKSEKERSSTPDLPLSVLNLGNIQPTKQPIPVITPNGLVQTKLSSNTSLNLPNKRQQTNRVYPQTQGQNNLVYQPSIISHQYADQAYGGFSSYRGYLPPPKSDAGSKGGGEDEEWSDFVSHQPAVQTSPNQPRVPQSWANQPNQFSNWINSTPNIIANPAASFDVLGGSSVQKQTKRVSGVVQNRGSSAIPCVSIPDLDFLAPRNRTSQRK